MGPKLTLAALRKHQNSDVFWNNGYEGKALIDKGYAIIRISAQDRLRIASEAKHQINLAKL